MAETLNEVDDALDQWYRARDAFMAAYSEARRPELWLKLLAAEQRIMDVARKEQLREAFPEFASCLSS